MRRSAVFPAILVAATGIYFFSTPVADNDLWGHVYFGREILFSARLPTVNQYSYTAPLHPWINHEIVAECLLALIFHLLSSPGLLALKLLLGCLTLAILGRGAWRRTDEPLAWAASLVLGASMLSFGYLIRPQLFTFLGLAWLWNSLGNYASGNRRGIWVLPLLFALWINTHGGVVAGEVVLAAFALLYPLTEGTLSDGKRLGAVTALSLAVLLASPYGWRLPLFLLQDVLLDRPITEWAAIPFFDRSNLHFKAALAILLVARLSNPRRRLWELAIVAAAAVAAFRHERHLPLFAIIAVPSLAEAFDVLIGRLRTQSGVGEWSAGGRVALAAGLTAIVAIQLTTVARIHRELGFQIFVSPAQFPVDALRFVRENRLRGNIAVPFGWGEYAIWHLGPDCPVSIDGRYTTAYPPEVIDQAWRYMDGSPGWDRTLAGAVMALADRSHATARLLSSKAEWHLIYSDDTALLFIRNGAALPSSFVRRRRLEPEGAFYFP